MAANLTVKKDDGTTDVVFTNKVGASGDLPAIYRCETVGTNMAQQPVYTVRARQLGASKRLYIQDLKMPYLVTDSSTGVTTVFNYVQLKQETIIPMDCPATVVAEGVSQFINLCNTVGQKNAQKTAYPPT